MGVSSRRTVEAWVDQLEDLGVFDRGEYVFRKDEPFTVDIYALDNITETLGAPPGFALAAKRHLRAISDRASTAAEWLHELRSTFTLEGLDGSRGGTPAGEYHRLFIAAVGDAEA